MLYLFLTQNVKRYSQIVFESETLDEINKSGYSSQKLMTGRMNKNYDVFVLDKNLNKIYIGNYLKAIILCPTNERTRPFESDDYKDLKSLTMFPIFVLSHIPTKGQQWEAGQSKAN